MSRMKSVRTSAAVCGIRGHVAKTITAKSHHGIAVIATASAIFLNRSLMPAF